MNLDFETTGQGIMENVANAIANGASTITITVSQVGSDIFGAENVPEIPPITIPVTIGDGGSGLPASCNEVAELINIIISKIWEDDNNRDGIRPNSICIELKANDSVVFNYEITGEGDEWSYTFEDKLKYIGDNEIGYTVEENGVTCNPVTYDSSTCALAGGSWNNDSCSF